MHAVLQRPSKNSFPDPEASNHPRKTRPRIQGTLHLNAVPGLMQPMKLNLNIFKVEFQTFQIRTYLPFDKRN